MKNNLEFKKQPYENLKCPECNGEMKSRTGKFGVFWGCKSYPDCKGTRDSQGRSKKDKMLEKGQDYEPDENDVTNKYSFKRTR